MDVSHVFLGTIVVSVPKFGIAIVAPEQGTLNATDTYLARLPLNDATTGAISQANYVDGTAVVCMKDITALQRAYILCPASYAAANFSDVLQSAALYNIDNYAEIDDKVFSQVLAYLLKSESISFRNYSHGADRDAIPGDTDIIDLQGNTGLHIGRYLTQLRGSPMCYIDVENIANTVDVMAVNIEEHLPLQYKLTGSELSVKDIAVSDTEAFGLIEGTPLTINDGNVGYTDENAIPIYRLQQIEGAAADGRESIVIQPKEEPHYCTVEPAILAKQRMSLNGALSAASANGICSIKSPAIQAIHQINYDKARSFQEQQDILKPWEYNQPEQEEEEDKPKDLGILIDDAAINKIVDKLLTGDYLEQLKVKLAEHGLKVSSEDASLAKQIEGEWKTGATKDPAYGPPPWISLTDPVTGKVTQYFASTSLISQEPDGSILICDGYGSEIRMSRGNIYISPALDLYFRPGRDLSAMVPRHQSYNAQGYTTINSSKSIYVRATDDLKLVGATGENGGMVTLENKATAKGSANGLIIKSLTGTAIVSKGDIYIGRNGGSGVTENSVDAPSEQGTIIIDACNNGVINMRCREQTTDSQAVYVVASNDNAASAFRLSPSSAGLYTNGLELPVRVSMVGMQSQEKITLVRDGQEKEIELTTALGAPQLVVEGHCLVGGMFNCNGAGHFCGQVTANGIGSTSRFCGVLDTSISDPFKKTDIKKLDQHTLAVYSAGMVVGAAEYMYQDVFITVNSFAFPADYGVSDGLRMPGMVWQEQATGKTWDEQSVISIDKAGDQQESMCYPGLLVWNKAFISTAGYTETSLLTGYRTNTI